MSLAAASSATDLQKNRDWVLHTRLPGWWALLEASSSTGWHRMCPAQLSAWAGLTHVCSHSPGIQAVQPLLLVCQPLLQNYLLLAAAVATGCAPAAMHPSAAAGLLLELHKA